MHQLSEGMRLLAEALQLHPLIGEKVHPDGALIARCKDIAKAFGGYMRVQADGSMLFSGIATARKRDCHLAIEQAFEAFKARLAYKENEETRGEWDREVERRGASTGKVDEKQDPNVIPFDVAMRRQDLKRRLSVAMAKMDEAWTECFDLMEELLETR